MPQKRKNQNIRKNALSTMPEGSLPLGEDPLEARKKCLLKQPTSGSGSSEVSNGAEEIMLRQAQLAEDGRGLHKRKVAWLLCDSRQPDFQGCLRAAISHVPQRGNR
mmetsp:Transcript_88580/g.202650  ORF Transcript_88580/g.202650 Transcript_88580/m.202650 type:complete len:106 (+) Transcript_88580:51-368(+)